MYGNEMSVPPSCWNIIVICLRCKSGQDHSIVNSVEHVSEFWMLTFVPVDSKLTLNNSKIRGQLLIRLTDGKVTLKSGRVLQLDPIRFC
jgi:hypothetical protein